MRRSHKRNNEQGFSQSSQGGLSPCFYQLGALYGQSTLQFCICLSVCPSVHARSGEAWERVKGGSWHVRMVVSIVLASLDFLSSEEALEPTG